jgi:hypothetical protein
MNLIDLAPDVVCGTIEEQAAAQKSPVQTVDQVLTRLTIVGLRRSVRRVRELLAQE